jgi:hypothetical protein
MVKEQKMPLGSVQNQQTLTFFLALTIILLFMLIKWTNAELIMSLGVCKNIVELLKGNLVYYLTNLNYESIKTVQSCSIQ